MTTWTRLVDLGTSCRDDEAPYEDDGPDIFSYEKLPPIEFCCAHCGNERGAWTARCLYLAEWIGDEGSVTDVSAPPAGTLIGIVPTEDAQAALVVDLSSSAYLRDASTAGMHAMHAMHAVVSRWNTTRLAMLVRRRSNAPCLGNELPEVAEFVMSTISHAHPFLMSALQDFDDNTTLVLFSEI